MNMEKKEEKVCTLYHKETNHRTKTVTIYVEDLDGDGELFFNIDYDIEYSNGEGQQGNAFVELDEVLKAYHVNSFVELVKELSDRYNGDERSWQKIVEELKGKGLYVDVDENESDDFGAIMTNIK